MSFPDAATRLVALVGHPVSHSISPSIHNAALRHEGVNAVYVALDVEPAALETVLRALVAVDALGANVTIPHKLAAAALASRRSAEVERLGAANTLVFRDGSLEAYNTDLAGVTGALRRLGADPAGRRCLVLGAGGAGRAVAWAVAEGGGEVVVANRTAERARELVASLRAAGHQAHLAAWEERETAAARAHILVNATSVGLDGVSLPLSRQALLRAADAGCRFVLDCVYGRREPPLVRQARATGIAAADGLDMLVFQAARAFELLCGRPAPMEVMAEAAARAAGRRPRGLGEAEGLPPIV